VIWKIVSQGLGNTLGLGQGTLGSLFGGNGTGREKAEDVVVKAADPKPDKQSAGLKYRKGAGRWMVDNRETGRRCHSRRTPNSHRDGQTENRKCRG